MRGRSAAPWCSTRRPRLTSCRLRPCSHKSILRVEGSRRQRVSSEGACCGRQNLRALGCEGRGRGTEKDCEVGHREAVLDFLASMHVRIQSCLAALENLRSDTRSPLDCASLMQAVPPGHARVGLRKCPEHVLSRGYTLLHIPRLLRHSSQSQDIHLWSQHALTSSHFL